MHTFSIIHTAHAEMRLARCLQLAVDVLLLVLPTFCFSRPAQVSARGGSERSAIVAIQLAFERMQRLNERLMPSSDLLDHFLCTVDALAGSQLR